MNVHLRAGREEDLVFARTIYFEEMRWIVERLFGWDELREQEKFPAQFKAEEVEIIVVDGVDVGWLQTRMDDSSIILLQLYVQHSMQRKGIGTHVLNTLLAQAAGQRKAVKLGVVKINPAVRLYQRHGFQITHDDEYKFYMKFDPLLA